MHTAPDENLIAAASQGSQAAFTVLVRRHRKAMLLTAVSVIHNEADAEDLLQDVLVEIWNKAGSFRLERGTVRTWLLMIVRNRAIDRLDKLTRYFGAVNRAGEHFARTTTQYQEADCGELDELLEHVLRIAKLTPATMSAFECHYLLNMTDREGAAHLGIAKRSYQQRLEYARAGIARARDVLVHGAQ